MEPRDEIKKIMEDIKQHRDELVVKLDLGKMEAKEQWEELEKKLQHLTSKTELIADEAGDAAKDAAEAAKKLAEEIKHGYDRIRKLL